MNYRLITKYLSNECTDSEKEEVNQWIQEKPEHQFWFDRQKQIWNLAGSVSFNKNYNSEKSWKEFEKLAKRKSKFTGTWIKIAAVFLVVSFSGIMLYLSWDSQPELLTHQNQSAEIDSVLLQDGTVVWLNKGSILTYPEAFSGKERMVSLEGEAFFHVVRNPEKPFRIKSRRIQTEVLGTSFNVKDDEGITRVSVVSGKVSVSNKSPESGQAVLEKHQKATLDKNGNLVTETMMNENELFWKTGILRFEDMKLADVFSDLEKSYQCEIEVTDRSISDMKMTAAFEHEELAKIMTLIADALNLKITGNSKNIKVSLK